MSSLHTCCTLPRWPLCRKQQATAAEKASKEANLSSAEKKAAEVKEEDGVKQEDGVKKEEGPAEDGKPSDGVVVVKAEENGEHEEEEEDSDEEFEERAGEVQPPPPLPSLLAKAPGYFRLLTFPRPSVLKAVAGLRSIHHVCLLL